MSALRYRHTQFGAVVVGSLAASTLVLIGLGLAYLDPIFTWGGPILMGSVALLFYNLTVEIDAIHLSFRFGIGWIRKRVPLAEIVAVQPVRNFWWYGWGIHHTPHGWLYNVSGREAVEITLTSGKRFRLGPTNRESWPRCWVSVSLCFRVSVCAEFRVDDGGAGNGFFIFRVLTRLKYLLHIL